MNSKDSICKNCGKPIHEIIGVWFHSDKTFLCFSNKTDYLAEPISEEEFRILKLKRIIISV